MFLEKKCDHCKGSGRVPFVSDGTNVVLFPNDTPLSVCPECQGKYILYKFSEEEIEDIRKCVQIIAWLWKPTTMDQIRFSDRCRSLVDVLDSQKIKEDVWSQES